MTILSTFFLGHDKNDFDTFLHILVFDNTMSHEKHVIGFYQILVGLVNILNFKMTKGSKYST